jgi:hypothetical protein
MTDAERLLVMACVARAAELWAAGDEARAEHWTEAGFRVLAGREFVDADEPSEAER